VLAGTLSASVYARTLQGCFCKSRCDTDSVSSETKTWCRTFDSCGFSASLGHWDYCSKVRRFCFGAHALQHATNRCCLNAQRCESGCPANSLCTVVGPLKYVDEYGVNVGCMCDQ
jgi:hypothetical protein